MFEGENKFKAIFSIIIMLTVFFKSTTTKSTIFRVIKQNELNNKILYLITNNFQNNTSLYKFLANNNYQQCQNIKDTKL